MPGNRPDMLQKAVGLAPDAVLPDLEDSVTPDEKEAARSTVAALLPDLAATGVPIIPRLNSLSSGLMEADLDAVAGPHIVAVVVGKIETANDLTEIEQLIERAEARDPGRPTGILPLIETARGIIEAFPICSASARVWAVGFGADDFTRDMGISRDLEGEGDDIEPALIYPRSAVAVAARAAGVQALDSPYGAYRDDAGLEREARLASRLGFTGKFAIHPSQLETINRALSPTRAEIEHAQRIIKAWEAAAAQGRGATSLDGHLVDAPVVERARAVRRAADQGSMR